MIHRVRWRNPSPLWSLVVRPGGNDERFLSPTILRFDTDDFMDRVQQLLADDPTRLRDLVVRPETWRAPDSGWQQEEAPESVKLFQPIHGRFYLVAGSLVCDQPGLPDRKVDAALGDQVGFVLRRLVDGGEEAWIVNEDTEWKSASDPALLEESEEVQPLFPLPFATAEVPRRLWAALLPVTSGETYPFTPLDTEPLIRARMLEFDAWRESVLEPLEALEGELARVSDAGSALTADQIARATGIAKSVVELAGKGGLVHAASRRASERAGDLWTSAFNETLPATTTVQEMLDALGGLDREKFREEIRDALLAGVPTETSEKQITTRRPKYYGAATRYVVRLVFRRAVCEGIHDPTVSGPSRAFRVAEFLDGDAPQRPVRIGLPTSFGDGGFPFNKFPRSMAFLLSKELRDRIEDAKNQEPFNLAKDPVGAGDQACSFSIPIVTLCAMILMIIIASILNIVFSWLSFLKVCVPIQIPSGDGEE